MAFNCILLKFKIRLVVDGRRTLQAAEVSLLVKLYRKRSMGALMSLGQPIDNTKPYQNGILSKYSQKTKQIPVFENNFTANS